MKIAMIGQKKMPSTTSGIEKVVEELSAKLVDNGYKVTCYNQNEKDNQGNELENLDEKIYRGISLKKNLTIGTNEKAIESSTFFGTIRLMFSKNDIIHFHGEGSCHWLWILRLLSRKKIVVTIHGLDWQRYDKNSDAAYFYLKGEEEAVKYAHEIIVLSKNTQQYFEDEYNRETVYIPSGVSLPIREEMKTISEKFHLKKNGYILYVGKITPEKGLHYLIDAYKNVDIKEKLVISAEINEEDEYYQELKRIADNNKKIIFTGLVVGNALAELYSNAYAFCLPSDVEGMSLNLLDAMSYGNCCLVSDIQENREVIGTKGLTFKQSDTNDLEKKLVKLSNSPDKVEKIKENTRDYIIKKYNWNKIVEETTVLYENM